MQTKACWISGEDFYCFRSSPSFWPWSRRKGPVSIFVPHDKISLRGPAACICYSIPYIYFTTTFENNQKCIYLKVQILFCVCKLFSQTTSVWNVESYIRVYQFWVIVTDFIKSSKKLLNHPTKALVKFESHRISFYRCSPSIKGFSHTRGGYSHYACISLSIGGTMLC